MFNPIVIYTYNITLTNLAKGPPKGKRSNPRLTNNKRVNVTPASHSQFALWKDMFTGRLRSEIPPSLRSLSSAMIIAGTQLIELDLSDNAFGPDGAEAIRSLLTSPVAYTIQTLR